MLRGFLFKIIKLLYFWSLVTDFEFKINEMKTRYIKAFRYVENAQEILATKAKKDGNTYSDKKYVKMAGNTLWNGVLEALDYKFPEIKKR
jgi:hypothetical protein